MNTRGEPTRPPAWADELSPDRRAELSAGDFFGEVSVLTGKPRTATITAKSPVTAIELTKEDVDRISAEYPEVPKILEEFYNRRAQLTVEAVITRLRGSS